MNPDIKLLSFIVPVYNVGPFLAECLDSLLNQDVPPETYEIICVDDGSADNSGKILDDYAARYANLIVIHQENGGVSRARNCALAQASGRYLWFVDPDDFIQDSFLPKLFQTIRTQHDPDMITFGVYEFGDYSTDCVLSAAELANKHALKNNRAPNEQYDATLCRHLYKRSLFEENGIAFDPEILVNEDNVVHFVAEAHVKTQAMLPEVGYFYRKRRNSLSSGSAERYYESRVKIATLFIDYYNNNFGNHYIAGYLLSSQLKMALFTVAKMKNPRRKQELRRLKSLHLFPLAIDEKDTYFEHKLEENSRQHRLYNKMYNAIYTRKGYAGMRLIVMQKKIKLRLTR